MRRLVGLHPTVGGSGQLEIFLEIRVKIVKYAFSIHSWPWATSSRCSSMLAVKP